MANLTLASDPATEEDRKRTREAEPKPKPETKPSPKAEAKPEAGARYMYYVLSLAWPLELIQAPPLLA